MAGFEVTGDSVELEAVMRVVPQSPVAAQKETETRSVPGHRLPIAICSIYPNRPDI
jgi:hypothetical protein